jgi:DNA-binding winged helix-turn-helix (wHTH) protein/tetratricopeptide (TPR) repeat protein
MTTHEGDSADLAGRRWLFGPAVLDERSLELTVGGQHIPLERKPLEVLLYLLHHAGEVVTKDDIAESLWTGRILTETVLARCISVLRHALKDDDKTLIRTVHGYGYRLVADVRVEASTAGAPPALDFKVGDHPPLRPQWKLVERLGTGGHGEAWLARHEKTGDARVFKFALDTGTLTALKREITLYRLLHDTLGARAAIARIYEWNMLEAPYFIEMEYVTGGNLQAWIDTQGGLPDIPLATRLELVAQIADALAAAHSVGALHKDLKPGNVLIHSDRAAPTVKLCDFGCGGILDPKRLEELGITRLGFTRTLAEGGGAGTPLYLAPEVVAGQPFTVKADIYALGVLLYQLVAADLRKPLAPGWEAEVADELLREDIAAAAAGNPERRLTDAATLAERLRTLGARREARAAEEAARQRAERARRIQEELRRTRGFAVLLLTLAAVATGGGVMAYRARNEAIGATATAQAISGFLMEDVFRMDSGLIRPSEASYEALLHQAAERIGTRLKDQPEAAASIHWSLGRRYQEIGDFELATKEYEKASAMFALLYGDTATSTLLAMDRLAWAHVENGQSSKALEVVRQLRRLCKTRLDVNDVALFAVRARLARTFLLAGDYAEAERELRYVADARPIGGSMSELGEVFLKEWFGITRPYTPEGALSDLSAYASHLLAGSILEFRGDYVEAESRLRSAVVVFSTPPVKEDLLTLAHLYLAVVLAGKGDYIEAEASAEHVRLFLDRKLPAKHYARGLAKMAMGHVRLEQQRFAEAVELFQEAVDFCPPDSGCGRRVRAEFLWNLGRANTALGRTSHAIAALTESLSLMGEVQAPNHPLTLAVQVQLAEAMRLSGDDDGAAAQLSRLDSQAVADLRPYQQDRVDLLHIEGLLLLGKKDFKGAVVKLREALEAVERRLGRDHWRSKQARFELDQALRTSTAQKPD